eukprot:CAMPEP_0114576054 /NCGR_PEP_ID=MMETSP0125-20121206/848_1 /TAXON_ID=485358 ORGANISM="Aristerostoma sp., Strain ATCC 50986" /NCGR_SAMPLE_ID=MMETSP0125 /ASSEMBLY_ACC=CAM_ASM_000245 /LENGTH=51 /DNA_ID=CAMNT_0001764249 /DNA_START=469 /DNA_END=624 /DNA_ORIENTATION=-
MLIETVHNILAKIITFVLAPRTSKKCPTIGAETAEESHISDKKKLPSIYAS